MDRFQMPRTVWLPANVPADAVAFYADLLKKVSETPEWKEYIERTSQTGKFLTGAELKKFIAEDDEQEPQGLREGRLDRQVSTERPAAGGEQERLASDASLAPLPVRCPGGTRMSDVKAARNRRPS